MSAGDRGHGEPPHPARPGIEDPAHENGDSDAGTVGGTTDGREGAKPAVGNARPKTSGQFRKGQSGNPRGRPPKQPVAEILPPAPARFPTHEHLRAEADRKIVVTDASGRKTITVREGILRTRSLRAMQGSVLAQRDSLRDFALEDECVHQQHKKAFEYWHEYQNDGRAAIAVALKKGLTPPDLLPHPDDIQLDWARLEVYILGAVDEAGRISERKAEIMRAVAYEMAFYVGEDNRLPSESDVSGGVGLYMAIYLFASACLPPRLRALPEAYDLQIMASFRNPRAWGAELKRRCKEARIPFLPPHKGVAARGFPATKLGFKWEDGEVSFELPRGPIAR